QDLPVVAGLSYTALRVSATANDFSAALLTPMLRIVQVDTQPSFGGCASNGYIRPGGLGFQDQAIPLTVDSGDLLSSNLVFMTGGIYRLCYSADGAFSSDSSLLPVPFELRVQGARRHCGFDRCLEEFPWRCFIYGDAAAPHGSCTVRVDALELFSANLARLSWGPSSDGTWACGADDGGNSSHLSLLPAAPLAVGPLEVSSGSQGREFHLQALAGTAFSVQTCLCPGYDAGNGLVCDQPEDFVQLLGKAIFFQSRSCSDGLCTSEYVDGVAASSAFTLRVDCGGLGLCSTAGSRLKIIDANPPGTPSGARNDRASHGVVPRAVHVRSMQCG
ncbi:unnamed protein product, partial [Durusdinium trenchii]